MQRKYDFYLAGPFFNPEQIARMDQVKAMLVREGFVVGDPREMGPVIVNASAEEKTPEFFSKIFRGNVDGMEDSFIILACLDYKDIGTAFELGYFFKSNKIVLTFAFDNPKTNVMLSQAVDTHFAKPEELEEFLKLHKEKIKIRSVLLRLFLAEQGTKKADTNE
jgi:nucleoside 2-deoxyribosyltransferase